MLNLKNHQNQVVNHKLWLQKNRL